MGLNPKMLQPEDIGPKVNTNKAPVILSSHMYTLKRKMKCEMVTIHLFLLCLLKVFWFNQKLEINVS